MNINATLLGQMITFALFVWFTMKFVWPPMIKALEDRQAKIADGLAAGERGHKELELAQGRSSEIMKEAKTKAREALEQAEKQAAAMVEDAKQKAMAERKRIMDAAQVEAEQVKQQLKDDVKKEVAALVMVGVEKVLGQSITDAANKDIIDDLAANI